MQTLGALLSVAAVGGIVYALAQGLTIALDIAADWREERVHAAHLADELALANARHPHPIAPRAGEPQPSERRVAVRVPADLPR